jgi:protein tyrosine phosphatase
MAATATIEGTVNFSNLTAHDVYNGQDTGAYSMTITLDEDDAATLAAQGVKIKDYQGAKQRKFKSKFEIKRFDAEGNRYNGEVPYNSKVRLKYVLGQPHPVHGVSTYLEAVKVLEEAEMTEGDDSDF